MSRRVRFTVLTVALFIVLPSPATSCSICNNLQAPTLREEASQVNARLILVGILENPRLGPGGSGVTDLRITDVLRKDDWLASRKVVELPRYLAIGDEKNPPKFLVFCDIFKDKLDPYRGIPIKSADTIEYVKKAMALNPAGRARNLNFFFRYLENPDPEVARDAFLEFIKASDAEIASVAPGLSADKLRGWLKNPQTPPERLNVYALLLGACGNVADADLLASMLRDGSDRSTAAYDGLLAGYIHLRPKEGWQLVLETLRDGKKPLPIRLSVMRTLRFLHGAQLQESQPNILQAMATLLQQGELADVAVEDMRRWKLWDLTPMVLSLYGKKGFDAPITRRAVVRYALSCNEQRAETKQFVAERRRAEPDLVQEVEESLQYEKGK